MMRLYACSTDKEYLSHFESLESQIRQVIYQYLGHGAHVAPGRML